MKNIIFVSPGGLRLIVRVPSSTTLSELFIVYCERVGIGEAVVRNGSIYFFFDAMQLNSNDQRKVSDAFKGDYCTILVIDKDNVIGALN